MRRFVWIIIAGTGMFLSAFADSNSVFSTLRAEFLTPPKTCTQVPFWFWNDDITEEGILQGIDWMEQQGVHGFLPHGRMGLSKNVGYMTDRWLQLIRFAVDEAAKRGMMVYLYDEGMYPSGSAHGKVVEGRPDLASQGLRYEAIDLRERSHTIQQEWSLQEREKPVAAILMKKNEDGSYQRESARVLALEEKIRIEPQEGSWTLFLFIQTPSGGVIRGVHWDEEDNQPNAPAAADILNPEVTQRFIQFTHEKYFSALQDHFGKTILGMFTDEPSILAKRAKRDIKPWTTGLLERMNTLLGYDYAPYLPLLWVSTQDGFETIARQDFQYAIHQELNRNFYTPLSQWCANHGIALTGHPAGSGDVGPEVYFQQPGQDVVWRYVVPGPTKLEGEHSTLGKSATSVAAQLQRPIVINECYGAYGWNLTMNEMKWLADWLFVRGTNRLFPHAFYYSVNEQRIYERPPDLSRFNLWANHYRQFSDYTDRMSWLLTESRAEVPAAIITLAGYTPWTIAKTLFQNQIDFHYLDETLLDRVAVQDGLLRIGEGKYQALILDEIHFLTAETAQKIVQFMEQGANVMAFRSRMELHPLRGARNDSVLSQIRNHSRFHHYDTDEEQLAAVRSFLVPSVIVPSPCPDLRAQHRMKSGVDFYLLTNEGEEPIASTIRVPGQMRYPEIWNAEDGEMKLETNAGYSEQGIELAIDLPPRQSRILVFPPGGANVPESARLQTIDPVRQTRPIPNEGWILSIGEKTYSDQTLDFWTKKEELISFSGTGWYSTSIPMTKEELSSGTHVLLDLGEVQSWAQVEVNGVSCGVRLWPPFQFDITKAIHEGDNPIRIGITNTRANELTAEKGPSGLKGPVFLRIVSK